MCGTEGFSPVPGDPLVGYGIGFLEHILNFDAVTDPVADGALEHLLVLLPDDEHHGIESCGYRVEYGIVYDEVAIVIDGSGLFVTFEPASEACCEDHQLHMPSMAL